MTDRKSEIEALYASELELGPAMREEFRLMAKGFEFSPAAKPMAWKIDCNTSGEESGDKDAELGGSSERHSDSR